MKAKEIKLSRGKVALVDPEDFEMVNQSKWHCLAAGYAARHDKRKNNKEGKLILMHRLITGAIGKQEVDHINGDKLDNRRSNLRICSSSLNKANIGLKKNNTSGYKGVSWFHRGSKWRATIRGAGKQIHLGHFSTKEEAAKAYNKKALELFGEFARVNPL